MTDLNLFELFSESVRKFDSKPAIIFGEHKTSYAKLDEAASRLATGLSRLGFAQGDCLGLILPNLPQFIICYLATLKLGVRIVPIPAHFHRQDITRVLEECQSKGVVALDRQAEELTAATQSLSTYKHTILLGEKTPQSYHNLTALIAESSPKMGSAEVSQDSTSVILYTSGKTRPPAGVRLSHRNLIAQVEAVRESLLLTSNFTFLSLLPFWHASGLVLNVTIPLLLGATTVVFSKFDKGAIATELGRNKDIVVFGNAEIFGKLLLLDEATTDFENLSLCVNWGAALSDEIATRFEEKSGRTVLQAYGTTEAGAIVSLQRPHWAGSSGSVGFPANGIEMKIANSRNDDEVGEILIRGETVMQGYVKGSHGNKITDDGWYVSGDLGMRDALNNFCILERKANLIVKGGFSVFPTEVEQVLLAHPKVLKCRVVGVMDRFVGEEVKVFVVLAEEGAASKEDLVNHCRTTLAEYKCPKYFDFVETLPVQGVEQ